MPVQTFPKSATGCRPAQLFGLYLMEPEHLCRFKDQAAAVDLVELQRQHAADWVEQDIDAMLSDGGRFTADLLTTEVKAPPKPYNVVNGVAMIGISGPTTKYPTSFQRLFGGTSTLMKIKALRVAADDSDVRAAMLDIEDAPGGTVAGSQELHTAIREFAKVKPIHAHITDLGASAAYLYASACQRVTANHTAHVGSIGVRSALIDTSKAFEQKGVRVIPITTGKFKGMGMDGVEVTPEHVAEMQRHVDQLGDLFFKQVAESRSLPVAAVKALEARVFMSPDALENKLIDAICSIDEAHAALAQKAATSRGHVVGTGNGSPVNRSNDQMNIAQIIAALGLTTISESAPESAILSAMQGMRDQIKSQTETIERLQANAPVYPVAEALPDLHEAAIGRIDAAMNADKLPPVIAGALREKLGTAEKPNAFMLARFKQLDNKRPIDMVLELHADATASAEVPEKGEKSQSQRTANLLHRNVPGGGKKDDDAPMSDERRKELLGETAQGRAILEYEASAANRNGNGRH